MRKAGLSPVIDDKTEVLILGSLPSGVSLAKGQYYANPSNDFWKLIGQVLNQNVVTMSYECRVGTLKDHGIGLWDIYHHCVRPGSMDKDITESELNDFGALRTTCPQLALVCFNGQKAGESEELLRSLGYLTLVLPSSSGANRRNQAERLGCWNAIREHHAPRLR
ncbi:MAG: DNA-deoxyinosine glycosylase [Terriglobales bacterium]|jgi:hypoxanthine-DNA glycosylase